MAGETPLGRRPWVAALLLGSVATPAAVILSVPAPEPLDYLLAWPLVVMDRWIGAGGDPGAASPAGPMVRLLALATGIVLTWAHYVLLARLLARRIVGGA